VLEVARFLFFKEDLGKHKHKVIEGNTTIEITMMAMPAIILIGVITLFHAYANFGVLGFLTVYLGLCIALLEIPHCIYDW